MALNLYDFTTLFSTNKPTSAWGFDATGNLTEYPAGEPTFTYVPDTGEECLANHETFTNLLDVSDTTLSGYRNGTSDTPGIVVSNPGLKGFSYSIGYNDGGDGGVRIIYRPVGAVGSWASNDTATVHVLVRMSDNEDPTLSEGLRFIALNKNASNEIVYKRYLGGGVYYLVYRGTAAGITSTWCGIRQDTSLDSRTIRACVFCVTRGKGWMPVFPLSQGEATAISHCFYTRMADKSGILDGPLRAFVEFTPISLPATLSSNLAGVLSINQVNRQVLGLRLLSDGLNLMTLSSDESGNLIYQTVNIEGQYGQRQSIELTLANDDTISVFNGSVVKRSGKVPELGPRRHIYLGREGNSSDRWFNCFIHNVEIDKLSST